MSAYYNENDPFAAAWLRELICAGHLPSGDVDERDIQDVRPSDLAGYTQHHFFAGIGGWAYALRLAGWPDYRPCWTGSCPCQPFSSAGQRRGSADERHLWPEWFRLIRECRPAIVFGEQVSSAIRHGWWDTVQADMEAQNYACGMAVLGAHSVGAPHIRQRCYFVGTLEHTAREQMGVPGRTWEQRDADSFVALANGRYASAERLQRGGEHGLQPEGGRSGIVANSADLRRDERRSTESVAIQGEARNLSERPSDLDYWRACDWLPCRDAKSRPVEPGTFPLAHGVRNRVGKLRGYGNAIVPQVAAEFVKAYMSI